MVLGCWQVNDTVKVETSLWNFEAHRETPCFLAEVRASVRTVATRQ
jgi:hypothetical protein